MTPNRQLFPALDAATEAALTASIERWGVLVPVVVDQHGATIDGHHRRSIAERLGVEYDRIVRHVENEDEALELARTLNTDRRHLDPEQRKAVVAHLATQVDERGVGIHSPNAIAEAIGVSLDTVQRDMAEVTDVGNVPDLRRGKDGKVYPAKRPQVFARSDKEQERAQQALQTAADVAPAKTLDVKRAERIAREKQADERREQLGDVVPLRTDDLTLLHCGVEDLDVEPATVDLVFTDPPYPAEFLHVWDALASFAADALKPGGLLLAYTGQFHMATVIGKLSARLDWWWCFAATHPGDHQQVHMRNVRCAWKPVLVFRKPGDAMPLWSDDLVVGAPKDKTLHPWQQAEEQAVYWIDRLTRPGALVVDPFLGSGTTAAACKQLGRRFVGCDVDPEAVTTAKERVS